MSVQTLEVVTCTHVAAASILVYDYMITIGREVALIWSSKFGIMNCLFMLTRYPPFVSVVLALYYAFIRQTTLEVCKVIHVAVGWMVILNFLVAEAILLTRSWIVWGKTRRAAIILAVLCAPGLAVAVIVETKFIRTLQYNTPEEPAPNTASRCPSVSGSPLIVVNIVLVMFFETFFLVAALVKGIRDYKLSVARSARSLTYVLYRDGILFFVYAFVASLVNLVAIVTLQRQMADALVSLQMVLHSSLTARIILNLRQAGKDSVNLAEGILENELTTIHYPRTCDRYDSNATGWQTFSHSSDP